MRTCEGRNSLRTTQAILTACARAHPTSAQLQSIRELTSKPLDWKKLAHFAELQSVAQLLASNLERADAPVPLGERHDIRMSFLRRSCEATRMAGELVRVVDLLRTNRIRAIALKGPALAAAAFGNIALRLSVDLDILVHPADAPAAGRLLKQIGYNGWDWPEQQDARRMRFDSEQDLICHERRIIVDLHWALAPGIMRMPATFDELWDRSVEVSIGGSAVRALSSQDLLMFLALHGAKHEWASLGLVCDIAQLVLSSPNIDWEWVHSRSRELGMLRIMHMGLFLASDLLDAPLPHAAKSRMHCDPVAQLLAMAATSKMFDQPAEKMGLLANIRRCLFMVRVRERLRDRLRFFLAAAAPTPSDLAALELPELLTVLYPLLRPFRILARHGRAAGIATAR